MTIESSIQFLFLRLAFSLGLAIFLSTGNSHCLADEGLENLNDLEQASFLSDDSAFEVEHVTTVDNEDSEEVDSKEDEDVPVEDNSEVITPESQIERQPVNEKNSAGELTTDSNGNSSDNQVEELQEEKLQEEEPLSDEDPLVEEPPVRLKAPSVPKARSLEEEAALKKVVYELKYGSLLNSIKQLQNMVSNYPYDPDYRALLNAAQNLREADVWYQYQRRLQLPPPSAKPKVIYKLIKMERKEKPINELKKASWFNLIKNRARLQTK